MSEKQRANLSDNILLNDALNFPAGKRNQNGNIHLCCKCKIVCISFFEHFFELLSSTCNFNSINTVEPISPPKGVMAGPTRLELATSGVTGQRSNQLNYSPNLLNMGGRGLEPLATGV